MVPGKLESFEKKIQDISFHCVQGKYNNPFHQSYFPPLKQKLERKKKDAIQLIFTGLIKERAKENFLRQKVCLRPKYT